ncbi:MULTISPECIES: GNAT family N-acetyltransferase [Spirosoma]|uniref:GNAT family N-acetyltransferase n=1 Tax=Spirosoma sordidisoli TaxID=2502893 RepID=A0A4Q2USN9_9BACT|nr:MULTISPECIES: GNAT family N-acetyltransferase [Spirosoma]RYC70901.1 GNAT family N-acetyltransferase [Spirosoma sordidisoli]
MITIIPATDEHLPVIRDMAYRTWPGTFGQILTDGQIQYMLEMMYSPMALRAQVHEQKHVFLLAQEADQDTFLGYVSYELTYRHQPVTKIHKLYIVPESQGKGVGNALVGAVADAARQAGDEALSLNVNRFNKAVGFYERLGFAVAGSETIDIGNGFIMDDLIMKKPLG